MNSKLCVAFGSLDNASAWASEMPEEWVPVLGMRTQFQMRVETEEGENEYEIVGQVVYIEDEEETDEEDSDEEEPSTLAFIYGGEEEPEEIVQLLLEANGWIRLDDDEARNIIEIVNLSPPSAAVHDVIVLVGDISKKDDKGEIHFEIWNRIFEPEDPILPMFGQRLFVDMLNSTEEPVEEGEPETQVEPVDLYDKGDLKRGIPGLVVYSVIVDPGVAQMAFWVNSLGDVDGFSLTACGWEKLDESDIDDEGNFRTMERIDLALRSQLDLRYDEEGMPYLHDFSIENAESVPETSYDILPSILVDHCRFAKEMLSVENVDNLIAGWEGKPNPDENL